MLFPATLFTIVLASVAVGAIPARRPLSLVAVVLTVVGPLYGPLAPAALRPGVPLHDNADDSTKL